MRNTYARKANNTTMMIIGAVFMGMCLMFSVWQSSTNSRLESSLAACEKSVVALEEQALSLQSKIARLGTPEYVSNEAATRNVAIALDNNSVNMAKVAYVQ